MNRPWIVWLAQGFGFGRIRFAPGTVGSLIGVIWFITLLLTRAPWVFGLGTIAGIALSIWACGRAEKALGRQDPPSVILDEIAAMPLCYMSWVAQEMSRSGTLPTPEFLASPRGLVVLGAGFVLFRVFDIWKPWPIWKSQSLPGGWGVTADDVLAALAVNVCFMAVQFVPGRL